MKTITLTIQDMHCRSCANAVDQALRQIPGVNASTVSLESGHATISYDSARTGLVELVQAVTDAGYSVENPGKSDAVQPANAIGDVRTGAKNGDGCCS